LLEVYYR